MKSSNVLIFVGVGIALVVAATLGIKGCRDKKVIEITYTQRQIDSVAALNEESGRVIDKLVSDLNRDGAQKDSLKQRLLQKDKQLEIQTLKVKVLTREAQLARLDTSSDDSFILACDSLLPQVDSLLTLSDQYRIENGVLRNSFDSLLSTNSLYIARLEFDKSFIQEKFDKVSAYALQLEGQNKTLDKKSKRRWGIGPFAGATYYNSKIQPTAGAGVIYQIIRF